MDYSLDLAHKQARYYPPIKCFPSKKKREELRMRSEQAEEILQKCEELKKGLEDLKLLTQNERVWVPPFQNRKERQDYLRSLRSCYMDSDLDLDFMMTEHDFEIREPTRSHELNSQYW